MVNILDLKFFLTGAVSIKSKRRKTGKEKKESGVWNGGTYRHALILDGSAL